MCSSDLGGHLIVTDVHPERIQGGWRRTFRVAGSVIEPPSTMYKLADLCDSRLVLERMIEAPLGAQERAMLVAAGKEVPDGPAIFAGCWRKLPG